MCACALIRNFVRAKSQCRRATCEVMLQTVLAATALAGLLFISGGNYDKLIPSELINAQCVIT